MALRSLCVVGQARADSAGAAGRSGAVASMNSARKRDTLGRLRMRVSHAVTLTNSGDGAPSIRDAMLIGENHEMSATLNSPQR